MRWAGQVAHMGQENIGTDLREIGWKVVD